MLHVVSRGRLVVLFCNALLVLATVWAVKAWPRLETGLALLLEVAIFAVLFSVFWKGRSRGRILDEMGALLDKRRTESFGKLSPPELGKLLLAELSAGPFLVDSLATVKERITNQEWHDLATEWPTLSNQLFAARTKPEAVKEAALVLAYVSVGIERLAASKA